METVTHVTDQQVAEMMNHAQTQTVEKLSKDELSFLNNQANAVKLAAMQAQLEDAKYANVILSLRLKYGLSDRDAVDTATGVIKRA